MNDLNDDPREVAEDIINQTLREQPEYHNKILSHHIKFILGLIIGFVIGMLIQVAYT